MIAVLPICLALAAAAAAAQQAPQTLSMDSALRMFLERNPSVKAARQRVEAARGRMLQAGRRPNPVLNYSQEGLPLGRQGANYDDQEFLLGASQRLELGGKRSSRRQEAAHWLEVQQAQLEDWLRRGKAQVAREYVRVRSLQSRQELASALLERYGRLRGIHLQRRQQGDVSGLSHLRVEAEEIRYRAALAQSETALAEAWNKLASWLSWPGGPIPALDAPPALEPLSASVDEWTRKALETRPDLQASRAAIEQARAEVALQRTESVPDLTLGGGFKRDFGQNSFYVGIELPLPLFDRNKGNVSAAEAGLEEARQDLEWMQIRVRREVAEAWQRYQTQLMALDRLGSSLGGRLQQIVEVTQTAYQEGEADLLDLLDAMRVELEASMGLADLMLQAHLSLVDLEAAVGMKVD